MKAGGKSNSGISKPMSPASRKPAPRPRAAATLKYAPVFAALGDETRLSLVRQLSAGEPQSITRLAEGSRLTRQAVTKHLKVLENAGLVRSVRSGRKSLCALNPRPLRDLREYLDAVSSQWDEALSRLKAFVED